MLDLVGNTEDRCSHNEAHIMGSSHFISGTFFCPKHLPMIFIVSVKHWSVSDLLAESSKYGDTMPLIICYLSNSDKILQMKK